MIQGISLGNAVAVVSYKPFDSGDGLSGQAVSGPLQSTTIEESPHKELIMKSTPIPSCNVEGKVTPCLSVSLVVKLPVKLSKSVELRSTINLDSFWRVFRFDKIAFLHPKFANLLENKSQCQAL